MDWDLLKTFLEIARCGSLGAAARQGGQTQPTVGRRLKALEVALGQVLFQRTPDGFVLTADGAALLPFAERMEAEAQSALRVLAGQQAILTGVLRLSCSDWFGSTLLAPVMAAYAERYPQVVLELLTDSRLFSLQRREADCVFRITPFTDPDVVSRRLLTVPYALYRPQGRPPPPQDGAGEPLIVMDSAFAEMPDVGWVQRRLPRAHVAARSNSRDVQARLCSLGVGLAVLPRPLGDRTAGIVAVDLGEAPPERETWLGYHRDLRRQPRLRSFVDLVTEYLGGGRQAGED